MQIIKIGTRGSKLALYQANKVKDLLSKEFPDNNFEIVVIKTKGDKILDVALSKIGDKGLFTKELEIELLNGNIDMAVHSLKDLPTVFPEGCKLAAILKRAEVRDVLISKDNKKISELPDGAVIGTSSLRRISQVLKFNPKFKIKDIRGNVETRLQKLKNENYDALIMAGAGIIRLGFENKITELLDPEIILPAAGQGAIAVETRINDEFIDKILENINHEFTEKSVFAERTFLQLVEGGCQVPVGCYTNMVGEKFHITGLIASIDGKNTIKEIVAGKIEDSYEMAKVLAEKMLKQGGAEILSEIY